MENDPHLYIEGMLIAARAILATRGSIYIRGQYHASIERTEKSLAAARAKGFLGEDIFGTGRSFDIELRKGAGSCLCGEELTMLESLGASPPPSSRSLHRILDTTRDLLCGLGRVLENGTL